MILRPPQRSVRITIIIAAYACMRLLFANYISPGNKKNLTMGIGCIIIAKPLENRTFIRRFGSIAQLGEHLPYKQRVIGSSPIVPTNVVR